MTAFWRVIVASILAAGGCAPAAAQVCHDWDGDQALAGFECTTETDCEDLSWHRRPGAPESCDGLLNDCDSSLDLGCDRYCDEVGLFDIPTELAVTGLPWIRDGRVGLMDDGFLAVSERVLESTGGFPDRLIYVRAHDRLGIPWAPAVAVGEPDVESPNEIRCEVAAAGERALVVWQDGQTRDQVTFRLTARVVDAFGFPIGAGPIDLSATSPVGSAPWRYNEPVWDGDRFVVFWAPAPDPIRNNLLMSVVHPDGTPGSPTTVLVTDDVDGASHTLQEIKAVWTGNHFVLFFWVDTPFEEVQNLRTLKVSRDGVPFGLANVLPITGKGGHVDMVLAEDRIGISWTHSPASDMNVKAAFLDLDGNLMDPPGIISVWEKTPVESMQTYRITWSGEMFGLGLSVPVFPELASHSPWFWYFWRLLPDGTVLDSSPVVLGQGSPLERLQDLHWAGGDFWWFAKHDDQRFERYRVVCSCQDEDGDLFDACTQFDCDDSDPFIYPFATEQCRGLKDEDCDGLVDCDDPQCGPVMPGPADVSDLGWSAIGDLVWSTVAGAERYDLARGLLSDLKRRGDLLQSECAGLELDTPSWPDDGRTPPAGDVLWYLVRPEGAPCELGSWGPSREISACR